MAALHSCFFSSASLPCRRKPAPGLGVPGFIAITCFALFFWMKFPAGTAEWLELIAFTLGLLCIGIEILYSRDSGSLELAVCC